MEYPTIISKELVTKLFRTSVDQQSHAATWFERNYDVMKPINVMLIHVNSDLQSIRVIGVNGDLYVSGIDVVPKHKHRIPTFALRSLERYEPYITTSEFMFRRVHYGVSIHEITLDSKKLELAHCDMIDFGHYDSMIRRFVDDLQVLLAGIAVDNAIEKTPPCSGCENSRIAYDNVRSERDQLHVMYPHVRSERDQLRVELDKTRAERDEARTERDMATREFTRSHDQTVKLTLERDECVNEIDQLQRRVARLDRSNTVLAVIREVCDAHDNDKVAIRTALATIRGLCHILPADKPTVHTD